MIKTILVLLTLSPYASMALAAEAAAAAQAPSRYTFSWPINGELPAPRGGTSKGPAVQIDTAPSPAWLALRGPRLSDFERDRRAILAMVGSYRVSFDFLEVASYVVGQSRDRPYQSWGTERIYLDKDDGKFISLVHLLEMRILKEDGSVSDPFVTKHWRQDWRFEPSQLFEYAGRERWQRRALSLHDRVGHWSQTVEQVDESPRYSSIGKWTHTAAFSTWLSADTWRPLPRREWTVRKDYQVLAGTNRVTITSTGWLQEENNLKVALDADRRPDAELPYRAREYGVARYERLNEADFQAADHYYERTKAFWDDVHAAWDDLFRKRSTITLRAQVDQSGSFEKLFSYAESLEQQGSTERPAREVIAESIQDILAP